MIEISLANTPADLARVLDDIDARLALLPLSAKRKYAVRLALDELVSNIIQYAYDDDAPHRIDLRLETGEPFFMEIRDDGKPFDPLTDAPAPVLDGPVEDRPIGGLGLHILKEMGLTLSYRRDDACNIVRVEFPQE